MGLRPILCDFVQPSHGPWQGGRWWQTARQAADEATGHVTEANDAVYGHLAPLMMQDVLLAPLDRNEEPPLASAVQAVPAQIYVKICLEAKGARVALKRWFDFVPAAVELLKFWHATQFVLLYMGLRLNFSTAAPILQFFPSPSRP